MKHHSNQTTKKSFTVVEDLVPNRRIKNLELVILRMYPTRMVVSDTYTGPVAAGCGRDHTGLVGMVFWNEQIQTFQVGDIVRIETGWCKLRNGHLVVSTGKTGTIVLVDR